jgi:hypothetical protein
MHSLLERTYLFLIRFSYWSGARGTIAPKRTGESQRRHRRSRFEEAGHALQRRQSAAPRNSVGSSLVACRVGAVGHRLADARWPGYSQERRSPVTRGHRDPGHQRHGDRRRDREPWHQREVFELRAKQLGDPRDQGKDGDPDEQRLL